VLEAYIGPTLTKMLYFSSRWISEWRWWYFNECVECLWDDADRSKRSTRRNTVTLS